MSKIKMGDKVRTTGPSNIGSIVVGSAGTVMEVDGEDGTADVAFTFADVTGLYEKLIKDRPCYDPKAELRQWVPITNLEVIE